MIAALIAIFVIAGILIKSTGTTNVNEGSRLVVVPTDATRTVVVPPCATGAKVTSHNETAVIATTGSTAVSLPQGEGTRLVVVPPCTAATSNLPSAAFVLKPGTPVPTVKVGAESSSSSSSSSSGSSGSSSPLSTAGSPATVQSQLSVPPGSAVRTVVVPPCMHSKTPPQVILSTQGSGTTTAVAPSC